MITVGYPHVVYDGSRKIGKVIALTSAKAKAKAQKLYGKHAKYVLIVRRAR